MRSDELATGIPFFGILSGGLKRLFTNKGLSGIVKLSACKQPGFWRQSIVLDLSIERTFELDNSAIFCSQHDFFSLKIFSPEGISFAISLHAHDSFIPPMLQTEYVVIKLKLDKISVIAKKEIKYFLNNLRIKQT